MKTNMSGSVAKSLEKVGIRVPRVETVIASNGLIIIEDYGDVMLETHVLQGKTTQISLISLKYYMKTVLRY